MSENYSQPLRSLPQDYDNLDVSPFARQPATTLSPARQLHRALARAHRINEARGRARQNSSSTAEGSRNSMPWGPERNLRRRFNRDPQASNQPQQTVNLPSISTITANAPSLPPLRHQGSRTGSSMSTPGASSGRPGRFRPHMERHRSTFDNRSPGPHLDEPDARDHEDANSRLRVLLDHTNPMIPSLVSPPLHAQDHFDEARRIKRRKLESDRSAQTYRGFRYGKYGQVEPGQLTMEIASCDGGLYSDQSSYAVENILRNDPLVYCTKGNRCNIVLRHQYSTVFSLQELIIKAPGSNYSSPVREGMVFIVIDSSELFTRTAEYQIQYLPPGEADQGTRAIPAYSSRRDGEGSSSARSELMRWVMPEDDDDEDEMGKVAHIPSEFIDIYPPPYNITTECTNDDIEADVGGNGLFNSRTFGRRDIPNRIGSLPFESDSSDDGADLYRPPGSTWATFDELARGHYRRGRNARDGAANMTLAEAREASQIATQEAVRAVGGELMAPLVHFHIEKHKNKCTIRFDPPVSGRYILVKMWNPHHDPSANIDIQAIIAKGFAGPRFFPSIELR